MNEKKVMKAVSDLRGALGLTQIEFTNKVGKKYSTVQAYETKRPPRGEALMPFIKLSGECGRQDLEDIFREALGHSISPHIVDAMRKGAAGSPADQPTAVIQPKPGDLPTASASTEGLESKLKPEEKSSVDRLLYILRHADASAIGVVTHILNRYGLLAALINREERASGDLSKLSEEIAAVDTVKGMERVHGIAERHSVHGGSAEVPDLEKRSGAKGNTGKAKRRSGH